MLNYFSFKNPDERLIMEPKQQLDLEMTLVDRMRGKMQLLQPQNEREELVERTLIKVLNEGLFPKIKNNFRDGTSRKIFVKEFLSYGVITDLLCDIKVEDIIINNLKPIYVHDSDRGFVPTNKRFSSQYEIDVFIQKLLLFAGRDKLSKIINFELPHLE
ncbi:MAG: Flp pilus assembly CpaF family ATPase, partial [Candidatus Omnitrophota bacterium]